MTDPQNVLRFTVPGRPKSKGRPRLQIGIRNPSSAFPLRILTPGAWRALVKASTFPHVHTDSQTAAYEAQIAASAWRAWNQIGRPELVAPYAVRVLVLHPRPKRLGEGPQTTTGRVKVKPDLNNVVSAVFDALQAPCVLPGGGDGPGLIGDDSQIVHLDARKAYAAHGEDPQVVVELFWGLQ